MNGETSRAHVMLRGKRPLKRVGVPGGDPLHFESMGTTFSWYGSSFQAALGTPVTYVHFLLLAALCVLSSLFQIRLVVPAEAITLLRFAATFNLVFYSGQVISRFNTRFHDFCKTNGACTLVTCQAAAQLRHDKAHAALLMRYANLMMHLYYLVLDGPLDDRKWQLMLDRGVLTPFEKDTLMKLKKKGQAVYIWANRILDHCQDEGKLTAHEAERLEVNLSTVRGLAAKQVAYQLTPVPKPYFHLMTTLTHVYLLLEIISASARVVEAWEGRADDEGWLQALVMQVVCTIFSILVLMAMWRTAIWLSNPVGNDVTDYDLDFDLRGLWEESLETLSNMRASKDIPDLPEKVLKQALSRAQTYANRDETANENKSPASAAPVNENVEATREEYEVMQRPPPAPTW